MIQNLIFSDSVNDLLISGVAGGTASGKTTVCNMIMSQLHDQRVVLVNQVIIKLIICFFIKIVVRYVRKTTQ